MDTLRCTICSEAKPLDQFYARGDTKKLSYDARCKQCKATTKCEDYKRNGETRRKSHARWRAANRQRFNHIQRSSNARSLAVLKVLLYEVLGEACVRCGLADKRALQIDHIHGNGSEERDRFGGPNKKFLKYVIATGPSDYQILCASCNWIKRHEEGNHAKPYVTVDDPKADPLYQKYRRQLLTPESPE